MFHHLGLRGAEEEETGMRKLPANNHRKFQHLEDNNPITISIYNRKGIFLPLTVVSVV